VYTSYIKDTFYWVTSSQLSSIHVMTSPFETSYQLEVSVDWHFHMFSINY